MSNSGKLVKGAKFVADYGIFAVIAVLVVTASIVRDVSFLKYNPFEFFSETLAVTILSTIAFVGILAYSRGMTFKDAAVFSFFFALHIAILHILLQLSGAYTDYF